MGWEDISQLLRRLAVFRMARPEAAKSCQEGQTRQMDGWTDGRGGRQGGLERAVQVWQWWTEAGSLNLKRG